MRSSSAHAIAERSSFFPPQTTSRVPDTSGATLTVDLGAIRDNYLRLRKSLGHVVCGAVVKADAYGLGAIHVAGTLAQAGCDHFFVAHLDEGVVVRPHLPAHAKIFVLHGVMPGCEEIALRHRLIPVLNGLEQIEGWADIARRHDRALPAAIQVDTGMSRLGLSPAELDRISAEPDRLDGIRLCLVMSQLACAEQKDNVSAGQRERFLAVRRRLPHAPASFASSAGIFVDQGYHFDVVRPGGALYGLTRPVGWSYSPRSVIQLQARIIQTRQIEAGDAVGYGLTFRADRPCRVATVAIGYADGFPRSLGNRGVAHLGVRALPIVGSVSMDLITLDVSGVADDAVRPGTLVDLIGPRQTVTDFAEAAGMIGDEVLTRLGRRYRRIYTMQ
jgi:alanine racemase